ncbi:MAG TPA: hypothetical protein VHN14_30095 [Kofleriaceae bacterium]|nr:hypothetical protein [Kofleriaceae bacterium]
MSLSPSASAAAPSMDPMCWASHSARSTAAGSIAICVPAPSCQPWRQRRHTVTAIWNFAARGLGRRRAVEHCAA